MRSRRGFPGDSCNFSRMKASGLRSPTNRSVLGNEGDGDGEAASGPARATGAWVTEGPPEPPEVLEAARLLLLTLCDGGAWPVTSSAAGVRCRHRFYERPSVQYSRMQKKTRRTFRLWQVGHARRARVLLRDWGESASQVSSMQSNQDSHHPVVSEGFVVGDWVIDKRVELLRNSEELQLRQ